jgi:hypothetical protein
MRFERIDQILEMSVMLSVIPAECVQTWMRRSIAESSHRFKHIKVNPVPALEQKSGRF